MTTRLEILKASKAKKEAELDRRFDAYFNDVKQANGQPLNDKRDGAKTLARWDRKSDAIRRQKDEIARTEEAIEREEGKIAGVEAARDILPEPMLAMIDAGELNQWRKHPTICFVPGVEKARMQWKNGELVCRMSGLRDQEQFEKFAKVFNTLKGQIAAS